VKDLEIVDDVGKGEALMCEHHFKKHYSKIASASSSGVSIIIKDTKRRGCRFCQADKIGFSPWSGAMFKIWKGFQEKENEC
jgi:hypothetical protein